MASKSRAEKSVLNEEQWIRVNLEHEGRGGVWSMRAARGVGGGRAPVASCAFTLRSWRPWQLHVVVQGQAG